jgi:predicted transcriptional regulator
VSSDLIPIPEVPGDDPEELIPDNEIQPAPKLLAQARKLKGYNLFLRGLSKREIADTLGVSPALVTKWSKRESWETRRRDVSFKAEDILDQAVSTEIADTLAYMRTKISERLFELDMACKKGSVTAIIAWLNRAGLSPKGEPPEDKSPKTLGVVDDVSIKGGN